MNSTASSTGTSRSAGFLSERQFIDRLEKATGRIYTPDQWGAMLHSSGPLWITAGPGSGKTEVLVGSALRLILCEAVDPSSIILTTFTRRAAANLSHRISSYLSDLGFSDQIDSSTLRIGTLHSICDEVMRDHRFSPFADLELLDEDTRAFFLYEQKDILDLFKKHWGTLTGSLEELQLRTDLPGGPR